MQVKRIAAFAAIYLFWGGSYLAMRSVVSVIPPMFAASLRYTISGVILLAISIGIRRKPLAGFRQIMNCCLVGILMIVVGYAAVFWSAARLPSWIVAVLVSTSFVWTYFGECFVLRSERMRPKVFLTILVGLVGIPILSRPNIHESQIMPVAAIVCVLAATFAWSASALALKHVRLPACHFQTAGLQLGSAGILLAGISCTLGEWRRLEGVPLVLGAKPILAMIYLVFAGSVTAFGAYHWLMQRESSSLVATFAYVNPMIAMIVGIGFAHEHFTLAQFAATAFILASVIEVWRMKASPPAVRLETVELAVPPSSDSLFAADRKAII